MRFLRVFAHVGVLRASVSILSLPLFRFSVVFERFHCLPQIFVVCDVVAAKHRGDFEAADFHRYVFAKHSIERTMLRTAVPRRSCNRRPETPAFLYAVAQALRNNAAAVTMLRKPFVHSPIVGATKPHHLDDAIASVSVKLTDDGMRLLEEYYVPHPVKGQG